VVKSDPAGGCSRRGIAMRSWPSVLEVFGYYGFGTGDHNEPRFENIFPNGLKKCSSVGSLEVWISAHCSGIYLGG
jgi:hypothetical protein